MAALKKELAALDGKSESQSASGDNEMDEEDDDKSFVGKDDGDSESDDDDKSFVGEDAPLSPPTTAATVPAISSDEPQAGVKKK